MINGTLVLEGGATRGVFTSGALDYLMEKDPAMRWTMCRNSRDAQETA